MGQFNDRFYPETLNTDNPVLKNKLNIKNIKELEETELEISISNLYIINSSLVPGDYDYKHLQEYHKFLFGDLYDWAGETRKFGVVKYEEVLSGGSVQYADPLLIIPTIRHTLNDFNSIDFTNKTIDEKTTTFCETLATVWQAHPFNEGNTRCITKFMCDAASARGLDVNYSLFTSNSSYFRKALVVYTYGHKDYLRKIVKDAIESGSKATMIDNKDLGLLVNSFVKGKLDKSNLIGKEFFYDKMQFEIDDLQKTPGKAQAEAIIKNCETQECFLEKNFAGSNPFKLALNKPVRTNDLKAIKNSKLIMD